MLKLITISMSIIGTIQMICVPPLLKWARCNLEENAQLKCIQDAKSAVYCIILHYITLHCSKLKFTQDGKSTALHYIVSYFIKLQWIAVNQSVSRMQTAVHYITHTLSHLGFIAQSWNVPGLKNPLDQCTSSHHPELCTAVKCCAVKSAQKGT